MSTDEAINDAIADLIDQSDAMLDNRDAPKSPRVRDLADAKASANRIANRLPEGHAAKSALLKLSEATDGDLRTEQGIAVAKKSMDEGRRLASAWHVASRKA